MAEIVLSTHDCLPCAVDKFRINGIRANEEDFGEVNLENVGRYTCRISGFTPGKVKQKILDKYGITIDEFYEICSKLDEVFEYRTCSYCS